VTAMSRTLFYLIGIKYIVATYLLMLAVGVHVGRLLSITIIIIFSKGKAVPLEAWSGPEGSRNLRFPDFMTTTKDGGKVVNLTHRPPLSPGHIPGTHFC
jgi:hypothetical protein